MSVALLAFGALAALAALAVPLLIHLARRPDVRTVDFAALRWIRARQRPQRRVTLEERRLLALRMLLLALLALYLAQPVLRHAPETRPWVVVIPGAELPAARALDLPGEAEWRWLAPGFPALAASAPEFHGVSSLLRELDAALPAGTTLAVVAPRTLGGLDGERPRLGREVDWRVVDGITPFAGRPPPALPRLALRHAESRGDAARYLRAAAQAWQGAMPEVAATRTPPGEDIDTLFWLHAGTLPAEVRAWASAGRTLVIEPGTDLGPDTGMDIDPIAREPVAAWRDAAGLPLATVEPLGRGRLLRMLQPLRPDALPQLLEPGFPAALHALLQPRDAPTTAPADTQRPVRARATSDGPGDTAASRSLHPWLALLIALLVLLERAFASRAQRWTA